MGTLLNVASEASTQLKLSNTAATQYQYFSYLVDKLLGCKALTQRTKVANNKLQMSVGSC